MKKRCIVTVNRNLDRHRQVVSKYWCDKRALIVETVNAMNLRDDILNYKVTTALSPKLIKTSREYKVLAILKYSFPERFSKLQKSEAPDLQEPDGELAVEVTCGGSPRDGLISGESVKYSHAKSNAEKERIRQKIRKNGGDRNDISTSYPVGTSEGNKKNVIEAFRKKLKK